MKLWYVSHEFIYKGGLQNTRTSIMFSHEEDAWSYVEWSIKRLNKIKHRTINNCYILPRTAFRYPRAEVDYIRTVGDGYDGDYKEIYVICSTELCEDFSKLRPSEDW